MTRGLFKGKIAIYLLPHAQGGKLWCPVTLFQVGSHINVANLTKSSSFEPLTKWVAAEKMMDCQHPEGQQAIFQIKKHI